MGTPDFASVSLAKLYNANFDIAAVFTQPDKPKNRGMKMMMSPVKELALSHGTPVFTPDTMKSDEVYELLRSFAPDAIAVVAYGKLLPQRILDIPKYCCVNIHGSILPKYRGSAPIQWTVLNGDELAGVTAMKMGAKMDAGDIIEIATTPVLPNETAGELFDRLAPIGGDLLCKTLRNLENGTATFTPQNEAEVTFAPPLDKSMSPIDWNKTADEILHHICGLDPWPCATAVLADTQFKIFKANKDALTADEYGKILRADKNGITVSCADGSVTITELQASGGKRMKAADYLRGHPICL